MGGTNFVKLLGTIPPPLFDVHLRSHHGGIFDEAPRGSYLTKNVEEEPMMMELFLQLAATMGYWFRESVAVASRNSSSLNLVCVMIR